jgi:LAO/AO transport system kinase
LKQSAKSEPAIEQLKQGILQGDRVTLARAITLIESSRREDQQLAGILMGAITAHAGGSIRIGITGVPGVGKSTFIEALGKHITAQQKKVAVLSIDPSSQSTKGSILGDKTRMEELARNPMAFIRPSPAGNILGGVSHRTREAMLLCEAGGYEVIIIETVGVGQSETTVKNMTDFFLLLMLAGGGDELQGIKKGITEVADAIVITKADGSNLEQVRQAQAEFQQALHLHASRPSGWQPKIQTASALTGEGISEVWNTIQAFHRETLSSGFFSSNRGQQNIAWMHEYFLQLLASDAQQPALSHKKKELEDRVAAQHLSPNEAAMELLQAYHESVARTKS